MTLMPGMSALVTGAGAGIGRATALRFAQEPDSFKSYLSARLLLLFQSRALVRGWH